MGYTFEINNAVQTPVMGKSKFVCETFSAMVNGKDKPVYMDAKTYDANVAKIKDMGSRATAGDGTAMMELNALRQFEVKPLINNELTVLNMFGNVKPLGFNDSAEVDVYDLVGLEARKQAPRTDVVFGRVHKNKVPVALETISAGYKVDYRQIAIGDMTYENEGIDQTKVMMRNNAVAYVIERINDDVMNAKGIKFYDGEASGLTKTLVDGVLNKVRRHGKCAVLGQYGLLTEFTPWAGYVGKIETNTITGISDAIINELAQNGLLGMYNGTVLTEIPDAIDYYNLNKAGDDFASLYPAGLGLVVPAGKKSPSNIFRKGDITSFTGNDVTTGEVLTRFDVMIGAKVNPGREHEIAIIHDKALDDLD